ncbi:MAG: class I SAM-dependent rRNA methyltransferase [Microbacter sp.]
MSYPSIILKKGKEEPLLRFHPWIFSGAVQQMDAGIREGDVVNVFSFDHRFLAVGQYQIGSITVRILSFDEEIIDDLFWKKRIAEAYRVRKALGLADNRHTNAYRLIHGEGDHLPGLIVDIYGHTAVIQAHSVGMHHVRNAVAKALIDVVEGLLHVYYKSEVTLPYKANLQAEDGYLIGQADESMVKENDLSFHVDWIHGQKTGFFIDQRENRTLLQQYAQERSVLNLFCYTGGFSVYALRGGAALVHSVDSSGRAIEMTNRNVASNFPQDDKHQAFAEDAFQFLAHSETLYDLIILDPPAFAKHKNVVQNALQGYRKLNAQAFEKIAPNGILFTFSCSQIVSKEQFRLAVFSAAAQSGRRVRILHQLTQPADHPINIYHAEGEYLKGLVLYVE